MLEHQAQRHLDHARAAHIGAAIAAVEFRSTAELSKLAIVHGSIARHESEVRVVRKIKEVCTILELPSFV